MDQGKPQEAAGRGCCGPPRARSQSAAGRRPARPGPTRRSRKATERGWPDADQPADADGADNAASRAANDVAIAAQSSIAGARAAAAGATAAAISAGPVRRAAAGCARDNARARPEPWSIARSSDAALRSHLRCRAAAALHHQR
jgi:hypothetical protein